MPSSRGLTVWRGDYTREKVVISFNPLTERFEVPNAATRRSSEWIDDITEIFKDSFAARDAYLGALRKDPGSPLTASWSARSNAYSATSTTSRNTSSPLCKSRRK